MEIIYWHRPIQKKSGMPTLIGANFEKLKITLKLKITALGTYRNAFKLRLSDLKFGCSAIEIEEQVIL